jgi:hypothetical protein
VTIVSGSGRNALYLCAVVLAWIAKLLSGTPERAP